jgi:hypothetical protein
MKGFDMSKPEKRFSKRDLGSIITAIVPLVAVILSASQIWVAHIAKEKEISINREQFEHQIKQDLVQFVTENQQQLFSENEEERVKVRDIISVAFPPEITEKLFIKLETTATGEENKETWRQAQLGIERIRRNAIQIQFFTNDLSAYKNIRTALRELGFNVMQKSSRLSIPINSIWFGSQVNINDVKLIALELVNSDVDLKSIRPFRNPSGARASMVQIGSDASIVDRTTLSIKEIKEATSFTR